MRIWLWIAEKLSYQICVRFFNFLLLACGIAIIFPKIIAYILTIREIMDGGENMWVLIVFPMFYIFLFAVFWLAALMGQILLITLISARLEQFWSKKNHYDVL